MGQSVRYQTCVPYNFTYCITLDMFYIQLIVLLVVSWNVNKIRVYQSCQYWPETLVQPKKSEQEHLDRDTDIHFTTHDPADMIQYLVYECWLTACPPYGLLAGGHPKCSASIMSFHSPFLKFRN